MECLVSQCSTGQVKEYRFEVRLSYLYRLNPYAGRFGQSNNIRQRSTATLGRNLKLADAVLLVLFDQNLSDSRNLAL